MKHLFTLKSLLLTLVMLCGLNAWGETETFNFVGWKFDIASEWDSNYSKRTISGSAYKVEFASANKNTSTIKDRPVTKGGDIIVSPLSNVTITGVKLTLTQWKTKTQTVTLNVSSDGTTFTATSTKSSKFSLSASELDTKAVKFTFSSSNQVGVESIEVTYTTAGGGEAVTVAKPTFSPAGGTYYAPQEVTIQIPEGADGILYTTDGSVPSFTDGVGEFYENTPITVSKTTTIKAIALDNSYNESAVAEATYTILPSIANTKETAYTTAQAIALIDKTSKEQLDAEKVYVKGVISKIDSFNETYGSITYWLDDNTFEVYGGLDLNNEKFTAKDNIVVGASVIVYGNVKKFNSIYEFDKNNYLVDYTAPAKTQSIAINGEATKTEYAAGETFSTQGLEVVATLSDGSTLDVTSAAAWTIEPETLALGTTTVKITAKYDGFSASKDVAVTVVAAAPSVTLDLATTAQIKGTPNEDLLEYDANVLTVSSKRTDSKRNPVNNYYPGTTGKTYTSTRFYTGNSLTFTPAANYEILSITYNATSLDYATALANSDWTNASATVEDYTVTVASTICYPVTIVPTDGTKPFEATIGATTGAKSMVIKYRVKTVTGLDAVLDAAHAGNVGGKYRINCALRVNYKDDNDNYVYASTTKGGCTKTAPTKAQKEEWWSDKEDKFNQNDWVAIQNSSLEVGAEIEAGSVATLVSNSEFPVIKFDSMKTADGTAIPANTYRVANFNINVESPLVNKLWLVAPQPAEHCFVKGYVDVNYVQDDCIIVHSTESANADEYVTMKVYYTNPKDIFKANGWYLFEGIVVNDVNGPQLKAISAKAGSVETGVEGVETSSVKVYGAEGVINVESEEVAPIAVYSANGAIVSSVEASSASIAVAPGFYIVKAGNSVSKVTVK